MCLDRDVALVVITSEPLWHIPCESRFRFRSRKTVMFTHWSHKIAGISTSILVLTVISALTIFLYFPALSGPFLLDDISNIAPAQLEKFSFAELVRVVTGNGSGPLGRPLSVITFSIDYAIGNGATINFKLTNLLIHLFNGLLAFLLISRLLTVSMPNEQSSRIRLFALVVTLIWLLHPLQISTVMYVVQRMTLISTFFVLLALNVYISTRICVSRNPWRHLAGYLLVGIYTLLACFSKENGVLVILYILMLEWLVLDNAVLVDRKIPSFRRYALAVSLFLGVLGLLILYVFFDLFMQGYAIRDFTLRERLMTQPVVLVNYLQLMFWPDLASMGLYNDDFPVVRKWNVESFAKSLLLLGLVAIAVISARRQSLIAFGIGLFLASHLLESTIFPLELVFEHRNYLGLLGIALATTSLVASSLNRWAIRGGSVIVCLILLVLGFQTHARAIEWSHVLIHDGIAHLNRPESERALSAYTVALANNGQVTEAIRVLNNSKADSINPAWLALHNVSLKGILDIVDQSDVERALLTLQTADVTLDVAVKVGEIYQNHKNGRLALPDDGAVESLFAVLLSRKNQPVFNSDLAKLYTFYSEILGKKKDYSAAESALKTAAGLAPEELEIQLRLAWLQWHQGEPEETERRVKYLFEAQKKMTSLQMKRFNEMLKMIKDSTESATLLEPL